MSLAKIFGIQSQVNILGETDQLNNGQVKSLDAKLTTAIRQVERGNDPAAANHLNAFINQVNALIRSEVLSARSGQPLIDATNDVLMLLTDDG